MVAANVLTCRLSGSLALAWVEPAPGGQVAAGRLPPVTALTIAVPRLATGGYSGSETHRQPCGSSKTGRTATASAASDSWDTIRMS
jgi:hypothetical protein